MASSKKGHKFGGGWTKTKLEVLKKYLVAYTTILKKTPYKIAYIDAFAGIGYIKNKKINQEENLFGDEIYTDEEVQEYIKGSAKISLEVEPQFDKYIFIELEPSKAAELETTIKNDHQDMVKKIHIRNEDSNKVLTELCNKDWKSHRALVFLDPYAMEAEWSTIEAIAKTEAIDLWILFPLGVSVNRLLMKNGSEIPENWSNELDKLFGTHEWYDEFYKVSVQNTLFGDEEVIDKTANFKKIADFYIKRLGTIFAGVVEEPLYLYNSMNNPIFLLCFASGNKKGSVPAIKIAKDIIGKYNEPKN